LELETKIDELLIAKQLADAVNSMEREINGYLEAI